MPDDKSELLEDLTSLLTKQQDQIQQQSEQIKTLLARVSGGDGISFSDINAFGKRLTKFTYDTAKDLTFQNWYHQHRLTFEDAATKLSAARQVELLPILTKKVPGDYDVVLDETNLDIDRFEFDKLTVEGFKQWRSVPS